MLRLIALCTLLLHVSCARQVAVRALRPQPPALAWHGWDASAFAAARSARKLVLLSVQADFCHWCHVMNATTYRDARVMRILRDRFVLVRVDQAERPDLATRYANYGWPATALLTPDAEPIVTLRGHQPAKPFAVLLASVVAELDARGSVAPRDAPAPEPSGSPDLRRAHRDALQQLDALYDDSNGGWGGPQKYPFSAPVQHALLRAFAHEEPDRLERALTTLRGHAALIDAVAGGMFQYSTGGRWDAPHYEKIAEIQALALRDFAEAYRATGDPGWLGHGMRVARYALDTLRNPDGCFAANQGADVGMQGEPFFVAGRQYYAGSAAERARTLAPALNEHVYTNLNGMLIGGLVALYRANAEPALLEAALRCSHLLERSARRGDAFAHEAGMTGVLYLSDQVAMIEALLALADATRDAAPRALAYRVMDWVVSELRDPQRGGFLAHTQQEDAMGLFSQRQRPPADNARMALLLLERARREHDQAFSTLAEDTLSSQAGLAQLRAEGRKVGEVLLALERLVSGYVMFSVVGPADDPRTRALYDAAYRSYAPSSLLRSDEPGEGSYPYQGRPSIFLCSETACSSPIFDAAALPGALRAFMVELRSGG